MREIKFRYRYTDGHNWLMSVFTLDEIVNGAPFEVLSDSPLRVCYKHVGQDQYTGLKDRHGKEIYEGDIVKSWNLLNDDKSPAICQVIWHMNFYAIQRLNRGNLTGLPFGEFGVEVIGNIYENPELLKQ